MHLYGLIIGIAIIIGLNFFEKHQNIIPKNRLTLFEVGTIISAIVGARAYHVIDQWSFYSYNLILIPQTWHGGLGIFGGIIGAIIFILFYVRFIPNTFYIILNTITSILPLCQAIGRLGNWTNGENPIWWPEAIGDLLLFIIITKAQKRYSATALYLIGYGLIRFLTEFWRTETWVIQNIKVGQVISLIFIIIGLILIYRERSKVPQKHL
ncbi:MAG: prolipoprotein diacylglyceryl transferase family protein [Microgenomates group bacterium]